MPRCIICDNCSETDGGSDFYYTYIEEEKGHVCNGCSSEISDAIAGFGDELEGPLVLEDGELEDSSGEIEGYAEFGDS